ncbi:MAG: YeeE/YedE thiosulfate transporter family protein [Eubacteriales bacterium]|nr:YeeE/YedE thiosulfate transporter family protein [Eubacteriales bacterium]
MLIKAIILGGFFGFALYQVGAHLPSKIEGMLRLEDFSLMKSILFAIGLSSVLLALAQMLGIFNLAHLSVKNMHLGVIVGGLIFALGFALGGTCPGTCMAALGSRQSWQKGLFALLGGLCGAVLFNLSYGAIAKTGIFTALDWGKLTLFKLSEDYPSVLGLGFSGLLITGLLMMGIAFILPDYRLPKALRESQKN